MNEKRFFSARYFKERFPEWKRKKDPFFLKHFIRPLSFYGASFCANNDIKANTVSYISGILALIACALFLPKSYVSHVIGAALFTVWIFMDCIDGNLARSVKKQPFGDFADAISSYMLVGFMGVCIAFAVYFEGGLFFEPGNSWILLMGALASSSDTMMRLMYHKYEQSHQDLIKAEIMPEEVDEHTDTKKVGSWKIRLEHELGIDGFIPLLVLICAVFKVLDIAVIYFFFYYCGAFFYTYISYVRKAMRNTQKYQDKMPQ